ncbi:MAG: tol-pal system protein YbgF [Candidatus Dadabacteria bacterium]|nr:MAG: tol-pal system protein YbgF [Candidatus Dadabacteria bacterium]
MLLLLSGCASAGLSERVDQLDREFRELRRGHAVTAQRLREIDRLNQTSFLVQDSIERLGLELQALRQEVTKMQQELRVVNAALFSVKPTDQPPAPSASAGRAPQPRRVAPPARTTPEAGGAQAQSDLPDDDRGIYQIAYAAMQQDDPDTAVRAFQKLLKKFPQSDLADNAHYWLGEIYAGLGDSATAEKHFHKILEEYPSGNKVPDAMYKLGVLAQESGDCSAAMSWYRKVREQYPWSPVSEKIEERRKQCEVAQ